MRTVIAYSETWKIFVRGLERGIHHFEESDGSNGQEKDADLCHRVVFEFSRPP